MHTAFWVNIDSAITAEEGNYLTHFCILPCLGRGRWMCQTWQWWLWAALCKYSGQLPVRLWSWLWTWSWQKELWRYSVLLCYQVSTVPGYGDSDETPHLLCTLPLAMWVLWSKIGKMGLRWKQWYWGNVRPQLSSPSEVCYQFNFPGFAGCWLEMMWSRTLYFLKPHGILLILMKIKSPSVCKERFISRAVCFCFSVRNFNILTVYLCLW